MQVVLPYLPQLLYATLIAVQIAILGILVSWLTGLIAAAAKDSSFRIFRWMAEWFIWFTRGAPPLIQILLIYFGMRQLGVGLSPFIAGVIALGVSSGGFVAEIVRSGMKAIPSGQRESCEVMGMSPWQAYRRIILPQMIRISIPAIGNEAINTLKNTSLLSAISVVELTMVAQSLVGTTIRPFEFYMTAALIYLALTSVISVAVWWYERRNEVYV